jgi:hypothetical protein
MNCEAKQSSTSGVDLRDGIIDVAVEEKSDYEDEI